MNQNDIIKEILRLADERDALILAHNYQRDEIQELAHITGDSLALSMEAARTDKSVIVFCGVHFMAESAAILAPEKTVLLPRLDAGVQKQVSRRTRGDLCQLKCCCESRERYLLYKL
jgi:quinolinate synthase